MCAKVLFTVTAAVLAGAACGSGDASLADELLLHVDFDGDLCFVSDSDVEPESADADDIGVDVITMKPGRLTAVFNDTSNRSAVVELTRFDPAISAGFAASDFEAMGGDGTAVPKPSYVTDVSRVLTAAQLESDQLSPGSEQFDFDLQPGLHGLIAWDGAALWACRTDLTTKLMVDVVESTG